MTYHIIVQPDLKLAVFSTGTNAFYIYDAEDKEIEEFFVKKAADDARLSIRRTLEEINAGTYQPHWPISFEDAEQLHNKYTKDPIPFGFRTPQVKDNTGRPHCYGSMCQIATGGDCSCRCGFCCPKEANAS